MAQVPVPGSAVAATACRLDAYRLAVEFDALVAGLGLRGDLRDQLQRASASCALCLAEGYGRFTPRDKRHFYTMALGSARECVAVLDLAAGRGVVVGGEARALGLRVVRTVEGLVAAMARR
jgi:four helix bundle protein